MTHVVQFLSHGASPFSCRLRISGRSPCYRRRRPKHGNHSEQPRIAGAGQPRPVGEFTRLRGRCAARPRSRAPVLAARHPAPSRSRSLRIGSLPSTEGSRCSKYDRNPLIRWIVRRASLPRGCARRRTCPAARARRGVAPVHRLALQAPRSARDHARDYGPGHRRDVVDRDCLSPVCPAGIRVVQKGILFSVYESLIVWVRYAPHAVCTVGGQNVGQVCSPTSSITPASAAGRCGST